jgi:hypothetical protein
MFINKVSKVDLGMLQHGLPMLVNKGEDWQQVME